MNGLGVFGVAACTSIGLSAAAAAAAVRSALSGFAEYSEATDRMGEPAIVAAPPRITETRDIYQAIEDMAAAALSQIANGKNLPVFLALPEPRPGLPEDLGSRIAKALAKRVTGVKVAPIELSGHAASGVAFQMAREYLSQHPGAVVAVLGVDSYLDPRTISWLDQHRQLHAPYNAWGFIPGAAAGACLLGPPKQSAEHPLRALIEDVIVDHEEVPIKTDGVCLGWGMTRVVQKLLKDQPAGAIIDTLYCDQNGETYRADEIGFLLSRTGDRFRDAAAFVAPADCWGDVGAASLPLFIALSVEAAARGYAPGPLSLHLAGSESGLRAGLRLRTPMRET